MINVSRSAYVESILTRLFSVTEEERTEHVSYLSGLMDDLLTEDSVRWDERGILSEDFPTPPEDREFARKWVLDLTSEHWMSFQPDD